MHAGNYEQPSIHPGCQCIVTIVIKSLFRELVLNMDSEFSFKSPPSFNAVNTREDRSFSDTTKRCFECNLPDHIWNLYAARGDIRLSPYLPFSEVSVTVSKETHQHKHQISYKYLSSRQVLPSASI